MSAAAVALSLAGLTIGTAGATAAFAQSAGDEQYRDPLAGERQQQSPTPSDGGPAAEQAPAAPSDPPAESAPSTPEAATPTPPAATTADGALPRTGGEPGAVAAAGLLALAAGALLRRRCA